MDDSKPSRALPQYQCHKKVWALQIDILSEIEPTKVGDPTHRITSPDGNYVDVTADYIAKHKPQEGGYWIRYEDGYESYSPAAAFESGYTLIESA